MWGLTRAESARLPGLCALLNCPLSCEEKGPHGDLVPSPLDLQCLWFLATRRPEQGLLRTRAPG